MKSHKLNLVDGNYPSIKLVDSCSKHSNNKLIIPYNIYKDFLFLKNWVDYNIIKMNSDKDVKYEIIEIEIQDNIKELIKFLDNGISIFDCNTCIYEFYDFLFNLVIQVKLLAIDTKSPTYGKLVRLIKHSYSITKYKSSVTIRDTFFDEYQIGYKYQENIFFKLYLTSLLCYEGLETETGIPIDLFNPNILKDILSGTHKSNTVEQIIKDIIKEGKIVQAEDVD